MRALLLFSALASAAEIRSVTVDASKVIGPLRNLQGSNGCNTTATAALPIPLHDLQEPLARLWPSHGIQHVMIYTWPDVFLGWGLSGTAGDATRPENYNWTDADATVRFILDHGAVASVQFNPDAGMNATLSSAALLGDIGFMIADRYMNGAHGAGFHNALDLIDFYPEEDLYAARNADYETSFAYFAGFARGVARANSSLGVGAWGSNRIWTPQTNYTLTDPFITQFYQDCAEQKVPIKAATYHFTNAQYSFDPYDIKRLTDAFRRNVLVPAGLSSLPVWVTEFDGNPGGALPTSASALASYNDPAWFASFNLAVSMYAQDADGLEQALPWTGFGYGGYGAGNASFPAWFNETDGEPVPLNAAAAWRLQADLVVNASSRLEVRGSSPDGFAVLAGRSATADEVQVLLNNYQLDYDIPRQIAAVMAPELNTSTTADPIIQSNGLLNGEQACLLPGTAAVIPVCQTFLEATVRNNTSQGYQLNITNLPWDATTSYEVQIARVGGGQVYHVVQEAIGSGNSFEITLDLPGNAQDLVKIRKAK
ncbi:hypothetical protein ASPZODRAFT_20604 [Penicilliopsis zonata CBS 506.65]|uniref:Beta-glucuronidase C-terminal domain-containing protein n=1 Tax=Penicilliopsis zonata CBS 506.65 TaxID=1073090 RepID=A0A1L9S571_9EURO|nr:hypothetical protein ASPZODRAFT_20604 [Penicilliopsis zonata CBS 506.65]OJJ42277.1 hypothetical protein ASPZODRAFT_20604 [Penicilliopsis zonata CBS 506.65]